MTRHDVTGRWRQRATRADGWAAQLRLAFVMLALIALAALPVLAERYSEPLNRQLRDVVEPARALVTQIHVALAMETSAFHDYEESGQVPFRNRYEQAYAKEVAAYDQLGRLTTSLGDSVQLRFDELRTLQQRWHATVHQELADRAAGRSTSLRALPREEDLYEDLLLAAAALDDALSGAAQRRRAAINAADQVRRRFAVVVGLVAIAAVGGVAWLGRRVRVYAREAERRRAQLERATESRARMMRGLSHDLKNPLGAIDGHAALLEEGIRGPLSEHQKASVARIRRSVRSLLALISDLLELSKAEAGQLNVAPRSADVAEVVRDAVEEHRAAAETAGQSVRVEISEHLPMVHTDPDRVRQVLGNLLSNAVKYTPSGGHILVRVAERAGTGGLAAARCAAIDVVDSGPGIPSDKLEQIFDEFSRLHPNDKPGAGLGLTIARRIARLLGGEISVASRNGEGAAFTLWLPVERRTPERQEDT